MRDLYQDVTNRIIAALEAGIPPWVKPWSGGIETVPANAGSKRPYRGVNALLLTLEATRRGYARNAWLTFRQAAELGGRVRGGEHGTTVVFYKLQERRTTPDTEGEEREERRVVPLLRAFKVFNVAQIEGLPEHLVQPPPPPAWEPDTEAERLLASSGARVNYGGARAFYQPTEDFIQLPAPGAFGDRGGYYATALHELVHWTGHHSRCNRQLGKRFGEEAYAVEELIAEMGSAFLCAHCRLDGQLQHASYIGSWLKVLKNDKRAVFTAAGQAQRAADFVLGPAARLADPGAAVMAA
jgi:antirestriction protein ArdC